jgi:hypothetical protein
MKTIAQCTAKFLKRKFALLAIGKASKSNLFSSGGFHSQDLPVHRLIMEEKHAADVASRVAACGEY